MALEYITGTVLKATLQLTGETYADADITMACEAASRVVDAYHGVPPGSFLPAGTVNQTRYYTADPQLKQVRVDPIVTAGTVSMDALGDGTYSETWVEGTDFYLDPPNAALDGRPKRQLSIRTQSGRVFPSHQRGVRVIGIFGWPDTPAQIEQATKIYAARLFKRGRETPYAILTVPGEAAAAAAHLRSTDPDVATLLDSIPGASKPLLV